MKQIDDIIAKMRATEYSNDHGAGKSPILHSFNKNEEAAIRGVLLEWIQDNFNDSIVEEKSLKQRVAFLEAMVSKSTFAPFVKSDNIAADDKSVSLSEMEELRGNFGSCLLVARRELDKSVRLAMLSYYGHADSICEQLGGESLFHREVLIEDQIDGIKARGGAI